MAEHLLSPMALRLQIGDLVMRIEDAFLDTPRLKLTVPAARRHFGNDESTCEAVLDALVDAAVLFKTGDRAYGRLFPRPFAA